MDPKQDTIYQDYFESPIGLLEIKSSDFGLTVIRFCAEKSNESTANNFTVNAIKQLSAYFNGNLKEFDLELKPVGTPFQLKVWNNLLSINYGVTTSYQKQAIALGNVKMIRAMAHANGKNPIAILIPCHRVIGTNGAMTGYAGEIWRKNWLLEHEAKVSGNWNKLF